jgi:heme exporter protein A
MTHILAVEISHLKKSYGLKPVLRDVSITLQQGECVALLGMNGAGKTTLLRIMAGLTKPDGGTLRIEGLDIIHDIQKIRRQVGIVGHQSYLYEELTALENLLFFGQMYRVKHIRERAHMLLQRVGLGKRAQDRVQTFSRGQTQRLAWARALLHSPRLLLLDEPDTGLDQQGSTLVETLLAEHTQQGGTTLFTTHQMERAVALGNRVCMLSRGKIVYQQETTTLVPTDLQRAYQEVMQ